MNGIHSGASLGMALSSVDERVFKTLSSECYNPSPFRDC